VPHSAPTRKPSAIPARAARLGFADPEGKIGFGYAMNRMQAGLLIDSAPDRDHRSCLRLALTRRDCGRRFLRWQRMRRVFCDPKFKRVKQLFEEHFDRGLEVGAAVAATIDGKLVLDLWPVTPTRPKTRPWNRDNPGQCLLDHQGHHRHLRASPRRSGQA